MTRLEEDTGCCRNWNSGSNANITWLETCDEEQEESNAKRSRPHDYKKSCAALKIKLSQAEEDAMKARQRRDKEKNEMEAEIQSLQKENTELRDVIKKLQAEIEMKDKLSKRADEKATSASTNERKAYAKLSEMKKSRGVEGKEAPNSVDSSKSLIKVLSDAGTPDDEIVEGFLSAFCQKKVWKLVVPAVLDSGVGKDIKAEVESTMYQSIQEKFAPWKCLLHLDLEASVSYRGLNVIRKIEFYGDEKTLANLTLLLVGSFPMKTRSLGR
jgi:predicted RNase H-like nuclease (RuvC/YqgF family)